MKLFPKQALVFMCLQYKSFENTAGKGEIAHNEQFLLFPQCFLPISEIFLPLSSHLKLSSANPLNLEGSKICRLGKLLTVYHTMMNFDVPEEKSFLAPLALGQRAYVMVCCPSCVRPSVRVCLTFSLNIFFSETTYRILMKFHRNVPGMVLFRIFLKNLIPSKTVVAMATKLKKKIENFENLLVRNHKG